MKKRTLPFGYEIKSGKVIVQPEEAAVVRELFEAYGNGASYQELSRRMKARAVPYHNGEPCWNKNKIARILGCQLYTGTDGYPAIIDESLLRRAAAQRAESGSKMTEETRAVKSVREISRCAACGGKIRIDRNRDGWILWTCADCGGPGPEAVTERVMRNLGGIWRAILRGDVPIRMPEQKRKADERLAEAESAFQTLLTSEDFDDALATKQSLKLAAMRYNAVRADDYETMRIQHALNCAKPDLDHNILRSIASDILIYPDGGVSVKLRNGQIVGRRDAT